MKTFFLLIHIWGLFLASKSGIGQSLDTQPAPETVVSRSQKTDAAAPAITTTESPVTQETWFLKASTRVERGGRSIELQAGTGLTVLRDNGKTLRVACEAVELDIDKKLVTNDPTIAAKAARDDQQRRADLAKLDALVESNRGGQTVAQREAEVRLRRQTLNRNQVKAALDGIVLQEREWRKERRGDQMRKAAADEGAQRNWDDAMAKLKGTANSATKDEYDSAIRASQRGH
jgi:hypothetical protein